MENPASNQAKTGQEPPQKPLTLEARLLRRWRNPWPRFFSAWGIGLVSLVVIQGLCLALLLFLPSPWGSVLAYLVFFASLFWMMGLGSLFQMFGSFALGGFLGVGGIVVAAELQELWQWESGGILQNLPVSEAPEHPDAVIFYFQDAKVRADLKQTYTHRWTTRARDAGVRKTKTRDHHVAPIVGPDWTASQSVSAWAVCFTETGCEDLWRKNYQAGLRPVSDAEETYWLRAIAFAKSAPGAPFLIWHPDPLVFLSKRRGEILWTFLQGPVIWVLAFPLFFALFGRKFQTRAERIAEHKRFQSTSFYQAYAHRLSKK